MFVLSKVLSSGPMFLCHLFQMCFRKEALTDDSEHGGHALVHGLYFDHGRVVDGDFLEGQCVNLRLCRHVNNFAGMKSDVVLVPDHWDLVM